VCAEAGVDSIEHGFELDADVAQLMAERGVALVTTMTVMKSWLTFTTTTAIPRFAGPEGRVKILDRLEQARHSTRLAHAAGVAVVGGTDFGGGSARANQLPWEVECLVEAGLEPWEALAAVTWRRRRTARRARGRSDQGRGPGRLLARARQPAERPDGAVAHLAWSLIRHHGRQAPQRPRPPRSSRPARRRIQPAPPGPARQRSTTRPMRQVSVKRD
jgi:hypothetical protein